MRHHEHHDREEDGRRLGQSLAAHSEADTVVLALARDAVPVAAQIARVLHAQLDIIVTHRVAAPAQPAVDVGAIGEGGAVVLDRETAARQGIGEGMLRALVRRQWTELARRVVTWRGGRPLPRVEGRTVILVADGIAAPHAARAAILDLRAHHPQRIIVAAPVADAAIAAELAAEADEVVLLAMPPQPDDARAWYEEARAIDDDEAIALLAAARGAAAEPEPRAA